MTPGDTTTVLVPVDLDKLEALLDPTRPEWCAQEDYGDVEICSGTYPHDCVAILRSPRPVTLKGDFKTAVADATLIAALRNSAPALIEELRRLRGQVSDLAQIAASAEAHRDWLARALTRTAQQSDLFSGAIASALEATRHE